MVKQERAVRTRQALIRAAAEAFAADGYVVASLSVISGRAGVSAGALHFHFADKDALASQVELEAAASVRQLAQGCRGQAGSALQSLIRTAFGLLLAVDDPVVRAGFRLSADPSRKSEAHLLGWWRGLVNELVVKAKEAGELAEDVSVDDAVTAIVAATVGFEVIALVDAEWPSVERVTRFWSLALSWLAAAPERVLAPVALGDQVHGGVR
ncbi:ScbR family autoregulator-binding transcription factor [Streptomyces sp. NPDC005728]|uniref:ScbR family autoregulator-binding transcription factor n=1 Tax=Streptomyces sp. NPDC005728 TaxID=3157054 RepID=UPI0033CC1585